MINRYKAIAAYGNVGLELCLSVLLGLFGGRYLDQRWGTHYLALVGFVLGVALGFRALWKALQRAQVDAAKEEAAEKRKRHG